ncbi:IS30 family transposase [Candidatus Woesebacteria bacterium]|nr:IS30 family transposase [Candidatus Woesebacteria bacterium]
MKHKKIQDFERDKIAIWKSEGTSNKKIAKRLGRDTSTIGREIKRNSFKGEYYVAIHAQNTFSKRKSFAGKRPPLKNQEVFRWTITRLIRGWSPEQIAGRMKLVFKNNPRMRIAHETIYSFIYSDRFRYRKFWEYLPWGRKKRKHKGGRKVHRGSIPNRVSIHLRPEAIDKKLEFGHFEGDTVEGKGHIDGVHTEVERVSRKFFAKFVSRIDSEEAIKAQKEMFSSLPKSARKSTTLDNGRENHNHARLRNLGMETYFADPYSSWQRGSNEYHNGLFRRYFPKGTDFKTISQEEIDECVEEINSRPRKCLGYFTPNEVFLSRLNSKRVAIQSGM